MCRGIGAIALQRDQRLVFKSGINSHSEIRRVCGVADLKPGEQVNLEALPGNNFDDYKNWTIHVDHDGEPPKWFIDDRVETESRFRDFFESELKEVVATGKYGGYLDLRGTAVTSLGSLQSVGGYLDLEGTAVTSLGSLQSVGEYLDLRGTAVTSLGSLQSVGRSLDLEGTAVTSLGSLQSVGGYLDLRGTAVTSLGSLQSVGGYLDLEGTAVTSLGSLQSVGGYLDLLIRWFCFLNYLASVLRRRGGHRWTR